MAPIAPVREFAEPLPLPPTRPPPTPQPESVEAPASKRQRNTGAPLPVWIPATTISAVMTAEEIAFYQLPGGEPLTPIPVAAHASCFDAKTKDGREVRCCKYCPRTPHGWKYKCDTNFSRVAGAHQVGIRHYRTVCKACAASSKRQKYRPKQQERIVTFDDNTKIYIVRGSRNKRGFTQRDQKGEEWAVCDGPRCLQEDGRHSWRRADEFKSPGRIEDFICGECAIVNAANKVLDSEGKGTDALMSLASAASAIEEPPAPPQAPDAIDKKAASSLAQVREIEEASKQSSLKLQKLLEAQNALTAAKAKHAKMQAEIAELLKSM